MALLASSLGRVVGAGLVAFALAAPSNGIAGEFPPLEGAMRNFIVTEPSRPAPAASFVDRDGVARRLSDFSGKVVLVTFWAVWCPACLSELPSLDRLQAMLGGETFTVLPVAQQSGDARFVSAFAKRRGLTNLRMFADPARQLGSGFFQYLLPTAILLDRHGREVGRLVGPAAWDSEEAIALICHYMEREDERDQYAER